MIKLEIAGQKLEFNDTVPTKQKIEFPLVINEYTLEIYMSSN